jgi:CRISPR type IV-associated protein Csf1
MGNSVLQTPPQFVWEAMLKTPVVKIFKLDKEKNTKKEKIIEYKCPDFEPVPDEFCWLCGGETKGRGLLKKRKITDMFSDSKLAQRPNSDSLCMGCGGLLSNAQLRFYSFLATHEGLSHPLRREWRNILLCPPAFPWVGGLSVSGQKHLFYKAPINFSTEICTVALEDFCVTYRPERLAQLLSVIEPLLDVFTKDEIKTGHYRQDRIRTYGLYAWDEAEEVIQTLRGNTELELALYVATKNEAKEEGD